MARQQILRWDDFTGGYHVGASHAQQPPDTWRGTNAYVDPQTGFLGATQAWVALTSGSGTITADGGDGEVFLLTDGQDVHRIYETTTANTWNIAEYALVSGSTVGITNVAISNCTTVWAVEPWDSDYAYGGYTPSSGTDNYFRYRLSTAALTKYTLPADLRYLCRWGQFMVGADNGTPRRLRFSNAYDPTTWTAGDYVDIGGDGPITALVAHGDTLFVGKRDEWYAVTGVLGSTTSVRQVALGYPGPSGHGGIGYPTGNAVSTPAGVLYSSTQLEAVAAIMNGGTVYPVNYGKPGYSDTTGAWNIYPVTPGHFLLTQRGWGYTSGSTTEAWWLDTTLGSQRWTKLAVPYDSGAPYRQGSVARQMPEGTRYNYVFMDVNGTIYRCPLLGQQGSTASTATAVAHLAERRADQAFTVRNLCAEIAWAPGQSSPSIALRAEMRGWPDLASPGRVASTSATATPSTSGTGSAPATALFHDDRWNYATVRIDCDGPAATGVVPILTFSNCKVRRVWATVDMADAS